MKPPIYLDANSTTPMDPEVLAAMTPYFCEKFGNPESRAHAYGWQAAEAVDQARKTIAKSMGTSHDQGIIFTSGATESNNLVIKGIVHASNKKPAHVITQKTEHKCILDSCAELEKEGHEVTYLNVDFEGKVSLKDLAAAIQKNTVLCSIMTANNEIGTLQPIKEMASLCHAKNILFHTDAVQAVGKIPLDVESIGIDFLSLSGHKIYGPKGIGALYIAKKNPPIKIYPLLHGGGQERGIRSGTLNVPGIVGLAKALEIAVGKMPEEKKRLSELRDYFINEVFKKIELVRVNGSRIERLPNNISFTFDFVKADELISSIQELAFSTGSACSGGSNEPSYVIAALGLDKKSVLSTVRFGLGRWTTLQEIDFAVDKLSRAVKKLRNQSLEFEMKKN